MLSVIIPTLNEEKYLPALLSSLREQQGVEREVIVADASSDDNTVSVANQFGAAVIPGGKPGAGRNRGAASANGDPFLFLDADVVLPDPRFLRDILDEFAARGLDIATCEIEPRSDERVDKLMHWAYNRYTRGVASVFPHAPGFFILAKRSLHDSIGGFDESVTFAEDQDYAARAAAAGRFGFLTCRKIPVSVRRFERDGRFNVAAKNVIAEIYMRAFGPIRSDFLKYRFGYEEDHHR